MQPNNLRNIILFLLLNLNIHLFIYIVACTLAFNEYIYFHSLHKGFQVGLFATIILSSIFSFIDLLTAKFPFFYKLALSWVVFITCFIFLNLSIFNTATDIKPNPDYKIKTFYIGLDSQPTRNAYIFEHLQKHGIKTPTYIQGLDVKSITEDYTEYIGDFSTGHVPPTTNLLMTATLGKSIRDGYLISSFKDTWFLVLENDAELAPDFTFKLEAFLKEKRQTVDLVWLYEGIKVGYILTGNLPCCTQGMVYNRAKVSKILSYYYLPFLEEEELISRSNPEPSDILLARLCNKGYLNCAFTPLVRESSRGFPSTH